jgi:predicted Na+-dependent transporter
VKGQPFSSFIKFVIKILFGIFYFLFFMRYHYLKTLYCHAQVLSIKISFDVGLNNDNVMADWKHPRAGIGNS